MIDFQIFMASIFAILLVGPIIMVFVYLLFKKDEDEQYNAAHLIGLRIKIWFTTDKAKKEALKDEHWVKSQKEKQLIENYEALEDLGIEYEDDEKVTLVIERAKAEAKAARTRELEAKKKAAARKQVTKKTVKKAPAKKTTAKKPVAKKAPAKKATTKKTTAKKTAAKKK